jgi:triphosphatase
MTKHKLSQDDRELELKFAATDAQLKQLRQLPMFKELQAGRPVTRKLRSVYFDTPELALRAFGASLRLRKTRNGWLQTLKYNRGTSAPGLFNPYEFEDHVAGRQLELDRLVGLKLPTSLSAVLTEAALDPVFEMTVVRTTRVLETDKGSVIEVAFDNGSIKAGERLQDLSELELELKKGDPACLFALARRIGSGQALSLSEYSKAERGYQMIPDKPPPKKRAIKAKSPRLELDDSSDTAFGRIMAECNDQIAHNSRFVFHSSHSEGPHQLRIGLRRLRSGIRAFGPQIDSAELRNLASDARDLGALLAELRDADVMDEDIVAHVVAPETIEAGLDHLRDLLKKRRTATRIRIIDELSQGRLTQLLIDLVEQTTIQPWRRNTGQSKQSMHQPVNGQAAVALSKSWKSVSRWGKRLDQLSPPERHEMRKALKGLRYQVEFFLCLYPSRNSKLFLKKLKRLQNVFGYLNDVAMAEELVELSETHYHDNDEVGRAAAFVLGWHASRAEAAWLNARSDWQALRRIERFWC